MSETQALAPHSADDFHPGALAEIYQDAISMAIWRRTLDSSVTQFADAMLDRTECFQTRFIRSPEQIAVQLERELPFHKHRQAFIEDVALAAEMFACLFELDSVGLRLAVLNKAMCPKFHVDHVPCRLICTYAGAATQWHEYTAVQRSDNGSLTICSGQEPNELSTGDIALLKGESWEGNEGRGLVHRSPAASDSSRRLVLTLDFA